MIERRQDAELPSPPECPIEVNDDAFLVDAALIGQLLHVSASLIPTLMREGQITSACERGIDEHEGQFRLTFFYRNRLARLSTDLAGRILRRSVIDFGGRRIPDGPHRASP